MKKACLLFLCISFNSMAMDTKPVSPIKPDPVTTKYFALAHEADRLALLYRSNPQDSEIIEKACDDIDTLIGQIEIFIYEHPMSTYATVLEKVRTNILMVLEK